MARLHLSAPWVIFYREVEALFSEDHEVRVIYDEMENEIKLYVDNATKANALSVLLPGEKVFGNVTLKISVVPANLTGKLNPKISLFEAAFENNKALSYIHTIDDCGFLTNSITYVVFKNKVVQFFMDDLGDINGNCSTLYQTIAKDIFGEQDGIFFCTDVLVKKSGFVPIGNVDEPLGEWP